MRWPDQLVFALRELWPTGQSCSVIAAEINKRFPGSGLTRNAVAGQRSRMELESRPSPVSKVDDGRLRRIRKLQAHGYSQIKIAGIIGVSKEIIYRVAPIRSSPRVTLAPLPKVVPTPTPQAPRAPQVGPVPATNVVPFPSAVRCCQFPLWGHKDRPKFGADGMPLFCNATTGDGPYCLEHKRKVYRGWNEVA